MRVDFNIYDTFIWQSDFNGYEVGYDDVEVVGFYNYHDLVFLVDVEKEEILEIYKEED